MLTVESPAGVGCVIELKASPNKVGDASAPATTASDVTGKRDAPWKRLDFDTELLRVKTAVALPSLTAQGLKNVVDQCASEGVGLLYWTPEPGSAGEEDAAVSQPWFTGYAVANAVLFRQDVSSLALDPQPAAAGAIADADAEQRVVSMPPSDEQNEELIDLGLVSGEHSRFRRDPALTRAQFEAMYRAWVCNSINRKAADDVFVCRKESGEVAGMITLKLVHEGHDAAANNNKHSYRDSTKENAGEHGTAPPTAVAVIGLLAVSPKFQRQGVGRTLMQAAFCWSRERRARAIEVGTQEENEGAMRFYASQGFEQVSRKTSYHIWIPSSVVGSRVRFNVPYLTGREARPTCVI